MEKDKDKIVLIIKKPKPEVMSYTISIDKPNTQTAVVKADEQLQPPEDLAGVFRPGVGRGLDFVILEELRKRTGITKDEIVKFAVSEMLCNSLDTDATEMWVETQHVGDFDQITVSDNGARKLTKTEIDLILDFDTKASTKRGFMRVSRGYLGNALKCLFGYTYALAANSKISAPDIVVKSHDKEFTIRIIPNTLKQIITSSVDTRNIDNKLNTFTIKYPYDRGKINTLTRESGVGDHILAQEIYDLIFATNMVNPTRKIHYNLWGLQGEIGEATEAINPRNETSVMWYPFENFLSLFKEFVMVDPKIYIKDFVGVFRGFRGLDAVKKILSKREDSNLNQKPDFREFLFPTTPIGELNDTDVERLFKNMRGASKTIDKRSYKSVLGIVGKQRFKDIREKHKYTKMRYKSTSDSTWVYKTDTTYPYIIEVVLFDREEDKQGLKIYQCVNFMASTEALFEKIYSIGSHVASAGVKNNMPVTVLVHFICPALEWLNYAKTGLGAPWQVRDAVKKAMQKVLPIPRIPRTYKPKPPKKPNSWVPTSSIPTDEYLKKQRLDELKKFADTLKTFDAARGKDYLERLSARGWCYVLEGMGYITKGEFAKCTGAISACRKLGFLPIDFVAEDQDPTRSFTALHQTIGVSPVLTHLKNYVEKTLDKTLAHLSTDYWEDEEFFLMMCVEKIDIYNLFKPICDLFNIPLLNSKGWYTISPRGRIAEMSKEMIARGLKPVLLLFYDHDIIGLKITNRFRKGIKDLEDVTGFDPTPENLIIERFGLNKVDIDRHNLMWIDNLETGSGKPPNYDNQDVKDYIAKYGERKCEANALVRTEETMELGLALCLVAIQKYYGKDSLERFKKKREMVKKKLKDVFGSDVWKSFNEGLDKMIKEHKVLLKKIPEGKIVTEKVHIVEIFKDSGRDTYLYGKCPACGKTFDYDKTYDERMVRCERCRAVMKLKDVSTQEEGE